MAPVTPILTILDRIHLAYMRGQGVKLSPAETESFAHYLGKLSGAVPLETRDEMREHVDDRVNAAAAMNAAS